MEWSKALKIALLEEDIEKIEVLIEELPQFNSLEQMKEAAYMMQEVHTFLNKEKNTYASKLIKIKKQKEFLNTSVKKHPSFDQSH